MGLLTIAVGIVDLQGWFAPVRMFGPVSIHGLVISLLSLVGLCLTVVLAIRDARVVPV